MKLKLQLTGKAEPLISWLTAFSKIRDSLLIEVDVVNKAFVAKAFNAENTAIRYSAIGFDACSITLVDKVEINDRIKLGLINSLSKLISIIERISSTTDADGNSNFAITINYGEISITKEGMTYSWLVVENINFVSDVLSMRMDGSRTTEFGYLSDECFFTSVNHVDDPITIPMGDTMLNSIIKTSDICAVSKKQDALNFVTKDGVVFVENYIEGKEPDFSLRICEIDDKSKDIEIPVLRDNFVKMIGKVDDSFEMSFGFGQGIPRILLKSVSTNTYIAVGGLINKTND